MAKLLKSLAPGPFLSIIGECDACETKQTQITRWCRLCTFAVCGECVAGGTVLIREGPLDGCCVACVLKDPVIKERLALCGKSVIALRKQAAEEHQHVVHHRRSVCSSSPASSPLPPSH